jgi:hydrocephalus-inducing protein
VLPQNEESKVLATYRVDQESGFIDPNQSVTIRVTLMTMKLREITLPLSILIVGANNGLPQVLNIIANSVGPRVEVCDGVREIDFRDVQVLRDYSHKLVIKNNSRIVADFHAFTKNKNSIFKPIEKKGVLQPDESKEIEVICCADDSTKF